MRHRLLLAPAPFLVLGVLLLSSAAPAYGQGFFEGLGFPAGTVESRALGVSPDGLEVLGYAATAGAVRQAVRWTSPGGFPVGVEGELRGASTEGITVMGSRRVGSGPFDVFYVTGGQTSYLSLPVVDLGGGPIQATARGYALSWDGRTVVGTGFAGTLVFPFVALDGVFSALPFLGNGYGVSADGRTVVGSRNRDGGGTEAYSWLDGTRTDLGDLAGGAFGSAAYGVSADGSVIVGSGISASGTEAFRWVGGTMTGLGDLPGGAFSSIAQSVSGDGSTVVGSGASAAGAEAFIWTAARGMRSLKSALESDYGFNLAGWTLTAAQAISGDGTVIVGYGRNPSGQTEAFRAVLEPKAPTVLAPNVGTRWEPGPTQIVTWTGGNARTLDILFRKSDTAAVESVAAGVERKDGYFEVAIPNEAFLCTRCRVGIRATGGTAISWSDAFSVKGYQLTRFNAAGDYEAFAPNRHGWPVENDNATWFPPSWWSAFDYSGNDPYTGTRFPPDFYMAPASGRPDYFPDWASYVDAFGTATAYTDRVRAQYNALFALTWIALRDGMGAWKGSCAGMVYGALSVFTSPIDASIRFGYHDQLYLTAPDPKVGTDTRAVVNALQNYQYSEKPRVFIRGYRAKQATDALNDIRDFLYSDDWSDDRAMGIRAPGNAGGHVIQPYLVTSEPGVPGSYRVWVYDPNYPGDTTKYVQFNTTNGTWSYDGFSPAWGGTTGAFVLDPVGNYYRSAELPSEYFASKRSGSAGTIEIFASAAGGLDITGTAGSVGYRNGTVIETMPDAEVIPNFVGGLSSPASYIVPASRYDITLEKGPAGDPASVSLLGGSTWMSVGTGRSTQAASVRVVTETNRIEVSPGGSSPDSVSVRLSWPAAGRSVSVRSVLQPSEAMTLSTDPVDQSVRLAGLGADAVVTLDLVDYSVPGAPGLVIEGVAVPAGADVTVRPDWTGLSTVTVETDLDRDGDMDRTVELSANRVPTGAEITSPASGMTLVLAGAPSAALQVAWAPGSDPDGETLTYRWEVSATPDFSTTLLSLDAGTSTTLAVPYGQLVGLIFPAGAPVGSAVSAFHRVVTRDTQVSVASFPAAIRFERGVLTGVEGDGIPHDVVLVGNYPNPFNPETTIRFGLPTAGPVRLDVFDLMGRRVRTLHDAARPAGWHDVRFDAAGLPSGTYVYRLTAAGRQVTRQMTVLR